MPDLPETAELNNQHISDDEYNVFMHKIFNFFQGLIGVSKNEFFVNAVFNFKDQQVKQILYKTFFETLGDSGLSLRQIHEDIELKKKFYYEYLKQIKNKILYLELESPDSRLVLQLIMNVELSMNHSNSIHPPTVKA